MTLDKAYESYKDVDINKFTSVKKTDEGLLLELTPTQRDYFIKDNNTFIKKLLDEFKDCNDLYKCVEDSEYRELVYYYDEKIPSMIMSSGVFSVAHGYALNYILKNNIPEWSVNITINNCNTGKEVISFTIPGQAVSIGKEE
ncbi:MAG: hypothetical protein E7241_03495 [Lachnospiraceae bacterium]|nr:hypothetical protein [Lachnospiraceae bacterium]